ncbi:MAG: AraC family transcriptional regulator [Alistipes sp.]|nr:AraC family transcriptional regulator [Alistipes sp.]MDE5906016.1 AraC family transcriptional regulator [Alistipes sp.]
MKNSVNSSAQQPMIVKYVETLHSGIQSQTLSRYAIGYILRGTMYIYDGDKRRKLIRGDIFYLGIGHHYIEHFPENGQPFEQILVYYTPADLQRILLHLNITYGLNISNAHSCENCNHRMHVVMPAWSTVRNFFTNTNNYLRDEEFHHDETAENIKMTELIYLIASHEDCCIKSKLLSNVDAAKESFEQTVYDHIFKDISIEELSRLTNRSLTSFKKEFRRHFQMPPHKWYIRQRLMHSRLLLISTSKSISEIGNECTFPNTSHFIKLFKKEYQMTPATYRNRHINTGTPLTESEMQQEPVREAL